MYSAIDHWIVFHQLRNIDIDQWTLKGLHTVIQKVSECMHVFDEGGFIRMVDTVAEDIFINIMLFIHNLDQLVIETSILKKMFNFGRYSFFVQIRLFNELDDLLFISLVQNIIDISSIDLSLAFIHHK